MKTVAVSLVTLFLATGCATATKTYAPDGKEAFNIDCSGTLLSWGMCYQKAGNLCGSRGYEIIAQIGDQGVILTAGQYGAIGGSVMSRSLLIKCKS